ncbi:MAG: DUF2271 domain-containing protein [Bacteroidetes bacterium]|nr:DUF2271 domain-containing protein [Bacteroidota bacterium]
MKKSKIFAALILCLGFINPLSAQTTGTLSFSCNTAAPSGNWGNKHVAAIWIQNNANPSVFIKTNAKYGNEDDHLPSWELISKNNLVDAVTGSTLGSYGTLSIDWDGTDVSKNVVMDGDYSIYIEMGWGSNKTNDHATTKFSFTKGSATQQLTPTGDTHYSTVSLKWQPTATLISSYEDKNGVNVFPNPSNGAITLYFYKELLNAKLVVSDLAGKIVYSENTKLIPEGSKTLNISGMPAGIYMLSIRSDESYFTYKLLIEE